MELLKDPLTLMYAILGGGIPAIFWLWFWLRQEDDENKEPRGLIALSFIFGIFLVIFAIWLERYSINFITDKTYQVIIWATIEEGLKFIGALIIILSCGCVEEPIDYPMYFIAVALGFAAFENILYLLQPINTNGTLVGMFTGNLRFLGSTLLHLIASSMIGSAMGLSFYIRQYRIPYTFIGLIFAIVLHSAFNFFIMKGSGENLLAVFGFLWVIAIINILIFEKLKRMGYEVTPTT